MGDYGLTPKGPNIKRLDTILDDLHTRLSERWGVNTRQNPASFLSHLLTNFADSVAELWEFGEHIYFSQYPSSAEGASLDNAAQFGGAVRSAAAKSYYPIHCTANDGTVLEPGTMIASATNPTTYLSLSKEAKVTRSSFNKATISVVSAQSGTKYTVALNGVVYSYTSTNKSADKILTALASVIDSDEFTVTVDHSKITLTIEANDEYSSNDLVLSENLTTNSVTSIITFGTLDTGDIYIPDGAITRVVKADIRLTNVVNRCGYIAGRNDETDAEFRKSYMDKIFSRSSMMLESIKSAIMNNVLGAKSVAPYENATNEVDELGRPPHSIEIVVDGGDPTQIAQQILLKKAGGISTYGDTTVVLKGEYDEDIPISFSRPSIIYTWFKVSITLSQTEQIPENYVDLLREGIMKKMRSIETGSDVVPQTFVSDLLVDCPGIDYIDIFLYATEDKAGQPAGYPDRSIVVKAQQRAYTTEEMIEVEIDG